MALADATGWYERKEGDPTTGYISAADAIASITQMYTDFPIAGDIADADIAADAAIDPTKIDGTAVVDDDARLTDARTPTAHAASHESGGGDELELAPSQITGTAVVDNDARLTDARTPTAHTHTGGEVLVTVNPQTDDYTLVLGDAGKTVTVDKGTAVSLTVPPNANVAFPTGTVIDAVQLGAGVLSLVAGSGVTITSGGLAFTKQYGSAKLIKTGTNTWLALGDLGA